MYLTYPPTCLCLSFVKKNHISVYHFVSCVSLVSVLLSHVVSQCDTTDVADYMNSRIPYIIICLSVVKPKRNSLFPESKLSCFCLGNFFVMTYGLNLRSTGNHSKQVLLPKIENLRLQNTRLKITQSDVQKFQRNKRNHNLHNLW